MERKIINGDSYCICKDYKDFSQFCQEWGGVSEFNNATGVFLPAIQNIPFKVVGNDVYIIKNGRPIWLNEGMKEKECNEIW